MKCHSFFLIITSNLKTFLTTVSTKTFSKSGFKISPQSKGFHDDVSIFSSILSALLLVVLPSALAPSLCHLPLSTATTSTFPSQPLHCSGDLWPLIIPFLLCDPHMHVLVHEHIHKVKPQIWIWGKHAIFVFLYLAYFSQHDNVQFRSFFFKWQVPDFTFFL